MRIALFTDTYLPTVNGVARTLGRLVAHAHDRGHEIGLISSRVSPDQASCTVFHHQLPGIPLPMYPELQFARPLDRRGDDNLAAFRPHLVHVATESTVGWSGRVWARAHGVPLVSSFHTDFPAYLAGYGFGGLETSIWRVLQLFHSRSRITFCPSSATRTQLRFWGFTQDLRIWSRGVDTEMFSPEWRRQEIREEMAPGAEVVLLYVGRLAPEKRLGILMKAFRRVREALGPRVALVLVGDGPWKDHLRQMAPEGVHFTGYRTGEALSRAYAAGDIFAFPSDTETFGNVVTEALASGLPVVAPRKGGVVDSVIPGETGILVPPGDPRSFGDALFRLATRDREREELARGARAFALRRSWAGILDGLLEDYRDALVGDGAGP